MAIQYSTGLRNAKLEELEVRTGQAAVLAIFSGTAPANCSVANSGTQLVSMTLPADYMSAASGGQQSKAGTWEDTSADADGTAGYFRLFANSTTNSGECVMQGTCGATSSGADMELDNTTIATGQQVTISTFTITAGNGP